MPPPLKKRLKAGKRLKAAAAAAPPWTRLSCRLVGRLGRRRRTSLLAPRSARFCAYHLITRYHRIHLLARKRSAPPRAGSTRRRHAQGAKRPAERARRTLSRPVRQSQRESHRRYARNRERVFANAFVVACHCSDMRGVAVGKCRRFVKRDGFFPRASYRHVTGAHAAGDIHAGGWPRDANATRARAYRDRRAV
ncbi:hypothetical protein NFJ02_16g25360 [Pycnococcus provasolii]